ncbi:MAG: hypothetical protein PHD92_06365 [Eubacteriales bacterium]|nr:hypothetical protein [Eubacteriales bacterium]
MPDTFEAISAAQMAEQVSEPDAGALIVFSDSAGALPSKKAAWWRIVSWILKNGSIVSAMLATNSVTQSKIVNAAVTHEKLGQEAVREQNIMDGEVKTDKIANGAVTSVKIAAGAVGGGHIENGAIANEKIANGAVTTEKIDEDGVRTSNINDGAVTFAKLNDDVKGFLRNISIQGQSAGRGNISGRIPPDYNVDSEYTHVFEFYDVDKEPIVLLEERGGWPLSILSRSVGGLAPGVYAVTIVVAGEVGRDINYRLISIE